MNVMIAGIRFVGEIWSSYREIPWEFRIWWESGKEKVFMSTDQEPGKVPSWPSLYNPGIEILHIEHHAPIQPQGAYLYRAKGGVTQNLC